MRRTRETIINRRGGIGVIGGKIRSCVKGKKQKEGVKKRIGKNNKERGEFRLIDVVGVIKGISKRGNG